MVPPRRIVVPVPRWSPKVMVLGPVMVTVPLPAREPLDCVSVPTLALLALMLRTPPLMFNADPRLVSVPLIDAALPEMLVDPATL